MKTFKDLRFKKHTNFFAGFNKRATLFFKNGYGASVITGSSAHASAKQPYEIAVLIGTRKEFELTYKTPITDDVIGYLTASEVTKYLKKIQKLPKAAK